jgi:hypothetical protein
MYNTYIIKNLLGESISEVDFAQAAPEPLDPESGSPCTSSPIGCVETYVRAAVAAPADVDAPWLAADAAVLYVVLYGTATRVQRELD